LPSDFDIFSFSTKRCSTCTQKREKVCFVAPSACAISFSMREDQIDTAGMDVDRRPVEQPQRHRRALDVPPGAAG